MLLNLVTKIDFIWIVSCSWSKHTILLLMFVAEKVLRLLVISLTVEYMGQQMSGLDSSSDQRIRHESEGWGFESPPGRNILCIYVSKKRRHFQTNIGSWVENEYCCPRTFQMLTMVYINIYIYICTHIYIYTHSRQVTCPITINYIWRVTASYIACRTIY